MKEKARYPELNLPSCRLRITERSGITHVWDPLRGRWLVLTDEEWVRRHVLAYLSAGRGIMPARICQEYPVDLNGAPQRADIVIMGNDGKPVMLIECKAPDIAVSRRTLDQAFRYNTVLGARYVMLTNGLDHYVYEVTEGNYTTLGGFPDL